MEPGLGRPGSPWTVLRDAPCRAVVERSSITMAAPFPRPSARSSLALGWIVCELIHMGWTELSPARCREAGLWERTEMEEEICNKKWMQLPHGVEIPRTENSWRRCEVESLPSVSRQEKGEGGGSLWMVSLGAQACLYISGECHAEGCCGAVQGLCRPQCWQVPVVTFSYRQHQLTTEAWPDPGFQGHCRGDPHLFQCLSPCISSKSQRLGFRMMNFNP